MSINYLNYKVKGPDSAYYISNFVSPQEEYLLLNYIYDVSATRWTTLSNRRLQRWGGEPHPKGMIPEPLPVWLDSLTQKMVAMEILPDSKKPNHALINEYISGQGIMPHFDGDLYYPVICTLSLGSHTVLRFHTEHEDEVLWSLLLEPGSLLILRDKFYTDYRHSIEECTSDKIDSNVLNLNLLKTPIKIGQVVERGKRVSITMRHIEKTIKLKLNLFKK